MTPTAIAEVVFRVELMGSYASERGRDMKVNMEVVRRRKRVASDETDHHHPFLFGSSSTSRNAQACGFSRAVRTKNSTGWALCRLRKARHALLHEQGVGRVENRNKGRYRPNSSRHTEHRAQNNSSRRRVVLGPYMGEHCIRNAVVYEYYGHLLPPS